MKPKDLHCKNPRNKQITAELFRLAKNTKGKSRFAYQNAAKSIQNFILPIKTSEDAKLLKGVGSQILSKIDSIIKKSQPLGESIGEFTAPLFFGQFNLLLFIDSREHNKDEFIKATERIAGKNSVRICQLPIGDFVWAIRTKEGKTRLIEPIIERKKIDDFENSLKDSRYNEQKSRLKKCGLKRIIYLVEGNILKSEMSSALEQAMVTTEVLDRFQVHHVCDVDESTRFIAKITQLIIEKLKNVKTFNELIENSIEMDEFQTKSKKNNNGPLELFERQLQCIPNVGREKAVLISKKFPSWKILMEKYESCSKEEGQTLLSELNINGKRIGCIASENVYKFCLN